MIFDLDDEYQKIVSNLFIACMFFVYDFQIGEVFINNVTFTETFTTRGTDNQTTTTAMWSIQTLHS